MLRKEQLNRNIVFILYGLIIADILFYAIAIYTSFGYLLYLNSIITILVVILIPLSIIVSGYNMIKEFSIMKVIYFALSLGSIIFIISLLIYSASVMSEFL